MYQARGIARPILATVGGSLLVLGSFLNWATFSLDAAHSASARGWDLSYGRITFVAGLILAACAAGWFVGRWREPVRLVVLLASSVALGISIYFSLDKDDLVLDVIASRLASRTGDAVDGVKAGLILLLDHGMASVSTQIGVLLVVIGSIVGLLAGVLVLIDNGRVAGSHSAAAAMSPLPPSSGPGERGTAA
jgi:hypothetical protein